MTNFSHSQLERTLTTSFKSSLLPLYETSQGVPVSEESYGSQLSTPKLSSIAQIGINIYCPRQRVDDYEHLICQELALPRSLYNRHQPIASVWWRGSPLQQFSPEAITELCFRLSSHFNHQQEGSTRGMTVTPMELDKSNLALIKGLNFTAIQLHIDASVASIDRSLSKIQTALQILTDYPSFDLSCVLRISCLTHHNFLNRLLKLLEDSHCLHIEVLNRNSGPTSLQDRLASENQLIRINQHFEDKGWRVCGNNNFFAPSHPLGHLSKHVVLAATPWGYMARNISFWFGLGVAALSLIDGHYQYNTPHIARYVRLLREKQPPIHRIFHLTDHKALNFQLIEQLLCKHAITSANRRLQRQLMALIPRNWLKEDGKTLTLNTLGIVNLPIICDTLSAHYCPNEHTLKTVQGK